MRHLSPNSTIRLMKDVEISGVIALLCAMCTYFACVLSADPHVCCCAQETGPVSMETGSRRRDGHTSRVGRKACAQFSESSESSDSFSEYLKPDIKAFVESRIIISE